MNVETTMLRLLSTLIDSVTDAEDGVLWRIVWKGRLNLKVELTCSG